MQFCRVKFSALFASLFALLFTAQTAQAEFFGLVHGRSADVGRMAGFSVDTGVTFGDDYQILAVRGNYKLTPVFMVFGGIGFSEFGRADGVPYGFGGMLTLENILSGADFALKASYYRASLDEGRNYTLGSTAFEAIVSTQRGLGPQGNLDFYGNFGVQRLGGNGFSDVELSIGGGIIWWWVPVFLLTPEHNCRLLVYKQAKLEVLGDGLNSSGCQSALRQPGELNA